MNDQLFTVGQAARATGLSPKAIRLYEAKALLPPAERTEAGYRLFSDEDLTTLRFIRQAKTLGLRLDEIGDRHPRPAPWRQRALPARVATTRPTHSRDRPHHHRASPASHRADPHPPRRRRPDTGLRRGLPDHRTRVTDCR